MNDLQAPQGPHVSCDSYKDGRGKPFDPLGSRRRFAGKRIHETKTNGWGPEIQQAVPYSPEPAVPSGPSLVGKGNILSLFIVAVGQDVDDSDLIHTYEDTSCEELLNHIL